MIKIQNDTYAFMPSCDPNLDSNQIEAPIMSKSLQNDPNDPSKHFNQFQDFFTDHWYQVTVQTKRREPNSCSKLL